MARRKRCVVKRRRKEEGKRRKREEKEEKIGDQIAKKKKKKKKKKKRKKSKINKKVRAHLFPLRSRHFLDQSEIRYLEKSTPYLLLFSCKIFRRTNYVAFKS